MNSDAVIRVEGLGKRYQLGHVVDLTRTLREQLTALPHFFKLKSKRNAREEPFLSGAVPTGNGVVGDLCDHETPPGYFWALHDITFEVTRGEVIGIIGRNGAGKSTLLKILSRITTPTLGYAEIHGRVGSLIEVGAGFHAELTGRENIFLNGSILGMKRSEIKKKLDEIVDFSGIEKHIDTPVKRYSSGMYVRLAFAVAAHLEPEILIIDEVLAVGDAEFQKKALGKMSNVVGEGRTVLFVSHNMAAVNRLCQNVILLKDGVIQHRGSADKVINLYLQSDFGTTAKRRWDNRSRAPGNDVVRLIEVRAHTEYGEVTDNFDITKKIGITMDYEVLQPGQIFTHGCSLYNEQGVNILNSHDVVLANRKVPRNKGAYSATVWIPGNFLAEGMVFVGVSILRQQPFLLHFNEPDVVTFNIKDKIRGDSARGEYVGGFPGIVRPVLQWENRKN